MIYIHPAFRIFLLVFVFIQPLTAVAADPGNAPSSPEDLPPFHSDRFIFRGKDVDDDLIILFSFDRGGKEGRYWGDFFGAIFERNHWAFLEGNDQYPYLSANLKEIQASYYARVEGTTTSGFVIRYDGGDYRLKLSSGPVHSLYTPNDGPLLKRKIGSAEAVVTIQGKEHWGDMIHESLVWDGFDGLIRYEDLYKEYQAFYLKTEQGRQIYFHQNKSDRRAFLKNHQFTETLQPEGGIVRDQEEMLYAFSPPLQLASLKKKTPPFALYAVPHKWEIDLPSTLGRSFLWARGQASKNWILGGYYIMAIEGVIKKGEGEEEERVWGFAEYFP